MLLQDDTGGLEVENAQQPGAFIPATPVPGTLVLNVGDLLQRWSNGASLFASPHPSRNQRSRASNSFAPFIHA